MTARLDIEIVRRSPVLQSSVATATSRAYASAQRARTVEQVRSMLEAAAATAARHVAAAHAEAGQLRDSATNQGYSDGERAWAAAAHDLAESRACLLANLERDCVRLALEIARQIVGAAVNVDRDLVDAIAQRACAALKRDGVLVLRISHTDGDRIEAIRERLAPAGPIAIEIDPSLASGECIAECGGVRVDGRFDVQLDVLARRLLQGPLVEGPL